MKQVRIFMSVLSVVGTMVPLAVLAVGLLQANEAREEPATAHLAAQGGAVATADRVEMGRMPDELRESSGLGISRTHPGVLWTHNDSGDRPRVYAIDSTATLLATFEVAGAGAQDWEAMALGPCPERIGTSCLYMADIGDNRVERESVAIYIIEEPDPFAGDSEVALLGAVPFVYPDGPHNAESLAITADADLIVVTKERSRTTWLFEIPAADVATAVVDGKMLTLGAGRQLPIRLATGAALNADGDVLAARTYVQIHFFHWPVADQPEQVAAACVLGDAEPQGEALAFQDDGRLVLTSESTTQRPGHLQVVRCPGVRRQRGRRN